MKNKTKTISVFGQIATVVGEAMVDEGKAKKIEANLIPPTVKYDEDGQEASFALVLGEREEREFDQRVRNLRA